MRVLQERHVPGSNKRMLERQAALEMEVQARAKAMADARRAELAGQAAVAASGDKRDAGVVGVLGAKEKRQLDKARGARGRRRIGM